MRLPHYSVLAITFLTGAASAQPQSWRAVVLHPASARESQVTAVQSGVQSGWSYDSGTGNPQGGSWQGSAATWAPLTDASQRSYVYGADENQQVGFFYLHAALWHGTPQSRIDLDPGPSVGALYSGASGVKSDTQVGGIGLPQDVQHASLWHGTPESFLDLHPLGAARSSAIATDGVLQGGAVAWTGYNFHAAVWNGTPGSVVDLNPPGAFISWVEAMVPGLQVGYAQFGGPSRPALWRGTAASYIDIGPPGGSGELYGTTGRIHVGRGFVGTSNLSHAIVNLGTPSAWVDLHQFLPSQYGSYSQANAVFQDGPTIYVGGSTVNGNGYDEAILWIGTDPCYANCDQSFATPMLNINDFVCFMAKLAAGDPYANCDGSTAPPTLNVNDFICFLSTFAAGCP